MEKLQDKMNSRKKRKISQESDDDYDEADDELKSKVWM